MKRNLAYQNKWSSYSLSSGRITKRGESRCRIAMAWWNKMANKLDSTGHILCNLMTRFIRRISLWYDGFTKWYDGKSNWYGTNFWYAYNCWDTTKERVVFCVNLFDTLAFWWNTTSSYKSDFWYDWIAFWYADFLFRYDNTSCRLLALIPLHKLPSFLNYPLSRNTMYLKLPSISNYLLFRTTLYLILSYVENKIV